MQYDEVLIEGVPETRIKFQLGQAKAVFPSELNHPEYQWVKTGGRDFATALHERIELPMQNGFLIRRNADGSIKFDDRKLRLDRIEKKNGVFTLFVGPTHYSEIQWTNFRAETDERFLMYAVEKGMKDYNDPHAYFANNLGILGIPVTKEGYIYLFKRNPASERFGSQWYLVAGFFDTDFSFASLPDFSSVLHKQLREAIQKEFREETGTTVQPHLLCVLRSLINTVDFIYVSYLDLTHEEFLKRIPHAPESDDHIGITILKNDQEIKQFLLQQHLSFNIRTALELYLKHKKKIFERHFGAVVLAQLESAGTWEFPPFGRQAP